MQAHTSLGLLFYVPRRVMKLTEELPRTVDVACAEGAIHAIRVALRNGNQLLFLQTPLLTIFTRPRRLLTKIYYNTKLKCSLSYLGVKNLTIHLIDNEYVMRCAELWIAKWMKTGWPAAKGKRAKVRDLLERLWDLLHKNVTVRWVNS